MNKIVSAILGIPKTLWFNFRYLPFNQAIRLPFLLSCKVKVRKSYRGGIKISKKYKPTRFEIRIGFHQVEPTDNYSIHTIIDVRQGGIMEFSGDAHIGIGAILFVGNNGYLKMGKNFAISGTTSIVCKNRIEIGNNVQFSYKSLIIDSDAHKIYDLDGRLLNNTAPIVIGSRVWIAPNVSILKGSVIPDNVVVASNSLVNKEFRNSGCIIG